MTWCNRLSLIHNLIIRLKRRKSKGNKKKENKIKKSVDKLSVLPYTVIMSDLNGYSKERSEDYLRLTLKALRANSNMKQSEVAQELGISATTWSKWENGKSFPDVAQVKEIEKLFGVAYDEIIFLS
ncbi:helix-turn-helix transcriptional regulator [Klebsiella pneumoniae]|uniref:helix-turn-helix transcriptional regulator n=1 Tax=Klebsiella pneumoniae TaxID=573 RepID=UPI00190F4AF3|nr:helix-turn-helix transcriptional regulator [Klebsiella pneumoniae]